MEHNVNCFELKEADPSRKTQLSLYLNGAPTKFKDGHEEIAGQHKVNNDVLYLVMLQNWSFDQIDQEFVLLNEKTGFLIDYLCLTMTGMAYAALRTKGLMKAI